MITVLFPNTPYRAIEERYASWQSHLLLSRSCEAVLSVDPSVPASEISLLVKTPFCAVVTTPLIVPPLKGALDALRRELENTDVYAAVPVANDTSEAAQHRPSSQAYLTLRQLEEEAHLRLESEEAPFEASWKTADPGFFLIRSECLEGESRTLAKLLDEQTVRVVPQAYFHRYAEHRSQVRTDLLELIDTSATTILEFGCGEGALGAALKKRQECRVVGIELDPGAAAIARTRLDAVHIGDVRSAIQELDEDFDWIVGGDVLEHLEEPWTFLQLLRGVAKPGGKLLLSLPNISAWPIVADLLRGRFDYVYMGILCAGHLRFFTKDTVCDMLAIAGWGDVALTDQWHFVTPEYERMTAALTAGGVPHSSSDLLPTGHYVVATNLE